MAALALKDTLIAALEEAGQAHDIDIVDVELAGASKAPIVRVRVDHLTDTSTIITMDEVAETSRWVSEVVEEIDPFPGSYTLEVSSPGMDRPLRRPRDFERFLGQQVAIKMAGHEGRRSYTGELVGFADGIITVAADDGTFELPLDQVQTANLKPVF